MNIQEAVTKAILNSKSIYRQSEKNEGIEVNILPTNTLECCLLITSDNEFVGKRWNPNANDLIADDWKVNLD